MTLERLLVEQLSAPIGLWTSRPRFSWQLPTGAGGDAQSAYELEIIDPAGARVTTGRVESGESVLVEVDGFEARSHTPYVWRVRVWVVGSAEATEWATSTFETSILDDAVWAAHWIEPAQESVRVDGAQNFEELFSLRIDTPPEDRLLPTPYLRQRVQLEGVPVRARLFATAHGIYQAELNGQPVGDQVFAPGVETYGAALSFQTYDVTPAIQRGANVVGMVLSDGWFAGRVGILGSSRGYGDRLKAFWQLHVETDDGRLHVFGSDATARGSTAGPIRYADLAVGERVDARIDWTGWSTVSFDDSDWPPVAVVDPDQWLVPFEGEPVRRVRELPAVELLHTPSGETVIDFGQVIAGRVRFRVTGERGQVVSLQHSEVLDAEGNFFMNILGPNKDQTDVYVLAGHPEGEIWEPTFTFHGFRYARITGFGAEVRAADFTAVVTASDLPQTGQFECSDERLNRLHENVVWSQRGNFLSIPTDCPQRERYGWTGDLQIFAPTAATNMGVGPFLSRWLRIVRDDQLPDGRIVNISPIPPQLDFLMQAPPPSYDDPILLLASSAGWGDAIAIVPHVLYERYGDRRVLEDNYAAMVAWVEYQIRTCAGVPPRLAGAELSVEERSRQDYLWNTVPHFGDWLAPSTLRGPDGSQMNAPRRTGEVVGCLFHGRTLELVAGIAEVLGRDDDAARYRDRARLVWEAFAAEYISADGRIAGDMQGPAVLALAFGAVPGDRVDAVVARLVQLIHAAGDHLDTGFVSVPFLLDVLWNHGHRDLARTLLWQDTAPSWLYEVDRGATTIWEGWEAIQPDGTVTDLSFNHYAFGCVDDWMYRRLAGLQAEAPGFRRSRIEPDFSSGLTHVRASIETPYGGLACEWTRRGDEVEVEVRVPWNTTSTLILPAVAGSVRSAGGHPLDTPEAIPLQPGVARFEFTLDTSGSGERPPARNRTTTP